MTRFQSAASPRRAISIYLDALHAEAASRGYAFDRSKVGRVTPATRIAVTEGQLVYEWDHFLHKLATRNPAHYRKWRSVRSPESHPFFEVANGDIEPWERLARS